MARRGRSGSDLLDTEACAACPAGKYVVARGSDGLEDCAACAAGTYSAAAGATSPADCIACPTGKYGSVSASASAAVVRARPGWLSALRVLHSKTAVSGLGSASTAQLARTAARPVSAPARTALAAVPARAPQAGGQAGF